jgi:hypothetical protein
MLAISLRPGIPRNPEHLLPGTSLGFEYFKQEKYISGYERGGCHVDKVNLPLSDPRLRVFIQGKEDWLEEGLLVLARNNKRGRIVGEGSSSAQEGGVQQNYVPPFGESLHRKAIMEGHQCKHGGVLQPCPHKIMWCPT